MLVKPTGKVGKIGAFRYFLPWRRSPGEEIGQHFKYVTVEFGTGGGQEVWIPKIEGLTITGRYDAARFANEKHAGCNVPSMYLCSPERVEGTVGNVRQIERGGAGATHGLGCLRGFDEVQ